MADLQCVAPHGLLLQVILFVLIFHMVRYVLFLIIGYNKLLRIRATSFIVPFLIENNEHTYLNDSSTVVNQSIWRPVTNKKPNSWTNCTTHNLDSSRYRAIPKHQKKIRSDTKWIKSQLSDFSTTPAQNWDFDLAHMMGIPTISYKNLPTHPFSPHIIVTGKQSRSLISCTLLQVKTAKALRPSRNMEPHLQQICSDNTLTICDSAQSSGRTHRRKRCACSSFHRKILCWVL